MAAQDRYGENIGVNERFKVDRNDEKADVMIEAFFLGAVVFLLQWKIVWG